MPYLVPSYRELYSISDLHLGGPQPKVQMFNQGRRLGDFIESLTTKPGPLALVFAGDIIDTLPYLSGTGLYVAVDGSASLVRTVMNDPSFSPVFDGLKVFLKSKTSELIVMTGNHDIELALPEAQEELLSRIAPMAEARGRVRFATNGQGFRCLVGNLNVYVTHGNEADYWNHVDHEALRQAAHARALGLPFHVNSWIPNAGTKLVVDAMNQIKGNHPFIDLLKPERQAAVRVLRAVAPDVMGSFYDALPAFFKAAQSWVGPHVVLGAEQAVRMTSMPETFRLLNEAYDDAIKYDGDTAGGVLSRVDALQKARKTPRDLVSDEDAALGRLFGKREKKPPDPEDLRSALKNWVKDDKSFDLKDRDDTCNGILGQVGLNVDVVIAGHTHLPRWITAKERGNLVYLNSGTWARLMGVREGFLETPASFKPVYDALMAKDITVLDDLYIDDGNSRVPVVLDATAAARVAVDDKNLPVIELVRITSKNGVTEEPIDRDQSVLTWQ